MVHRLHILLLFVVSALLFSITIRAQDLNLENVALNLENENRPESYLRRSWKKQVSWVSRLTVPDPGNTPSTFLIPGVTHHSYGSRYLDSLYKQILCLCSLYWLWAGYRLYHFEHPTGRISDK